MHCAVLGTIRQYGKLWFDPKNHLEPFYIGGAKEEINRRLSKIKPPFYVSRPPRNTKDMKFWKAHEWYWWGIVYSVPVLKNILPNLYLRHWILFVEALFLLLQESIPKSQVFNGIELMALFTKDIEKLYGKEHCSFNVHTCEHLGKCVLDWGPLPDNSCFIYEDFNQVILKTIHSSKGVLDQVISQIRTIRSIPFILSTPAGNAILGMSVAKAERLLSPKNSVVCAQGNLEVLVLSPKLRAISREERLAFASQSVTLKMREKLFFSQRIVVNGEVFHSKTIKVIKQRNSYTDLLTNGKIFMVHKYVIVNALCYAVGTYLKSVKSFKLMADSRDLPHQIFVSKDAEPLSIVDVRDFVSKVVFLDCDYLNVNLVCIPPNRIDILK